MKDAQKKQILDYLQENKSITPREALDLFGCMRLGARIFDLKREGHQISTTIITVPCRGGGVSRIAEYRLEADA